MERCLHYISQRLYLRKDAVIRPSVPDAAWLSASLSRFARTLPAQPPRHFSQKKPLAGIVIEEQIPVVGNVSEASEAWSLSEAP